MMSTLDTTKTLRTPTTVRTLDIAYTPDSDDAFNFYGWEQGYVTLPGFDARFARDHIAELNSAAKRGAYDVVAISSVAYPALADQYAILSVGSSVGRGYGPVLVARQPVSIESLSGKRVAVAAVNTTGGTLARLYCPPDVTLVPLAYDKIADSVLGGESDAGVMIHEELIHYPQLGLHRVKDLGAEWTERTGLPLPVGLNIVKRSLGRAAAIDIARTCRDSLLWSLVHKGDAMRHVSRYGRQCAETFVPMFSNDDTLRMPDDVRRGLRVLCDILAERGWAPRLETSEVIDA